MSVRERLRRAAAELRAAGVPDPEYDSGLLLAKVTGRDALSLRLDFENELTKEQEETFRKLLARRAGREPLQYLLGTVIFCGREFAVGPGALIPRPETELLAEWALEALESRGKPEVLDLCCGSGCLGLTIGARRSDARVTLSDLSPEALCWTRQNQERLAARNCEILQGDLWEPVTGRAFDCVVCNPPYIPETEEESLQPELEREPRMALFGGADGLDFYRRIAEQAREHMKPGGCLLLEVGIHQAEKAARLLRTGGANRTEIRKDDAGIQRMVLGEYE